METTTVRTKTVNLDGGRVLKVSMYAGESDGRVLLSKGWGDTIEIAGLGGEQTLTIPADALESVLDTLRDLKASP